MLFTITSTSSSFSVCACLQFEDHQRRTPTRRVSLTDISDERRRQPRALPTTDFELFNDIPLMESALEEQVEFPEDEPPRIESPPPEPEPEVLEEEEEPEPVIAEPTIDLQPLSMDVLPAIHEEEQDTPQPEGGEKAIPSQPEPASPTRPQPAPLTDIASSPEKPASAIPSEPVAPVHSEPAPGKIGEEVSMRFFFIYSMFLLLGLFCEMYQ